MPPTLFKTGMVRIREYRQKKKVTYNNPYVGFKVNCNQSRQKVYGNKKENAIVFSFHLNYVI